MVRGRWHTATPAVAQNYADEPVDSEPKQWAVKLRTANRTTLTNNDDHLWVNHHKHLSPNSSHMILVNIKHVNYVNILS